MAKEIYEIPCAESISVMPAGYNVIAMDCYFDHRSVACFSNESDAEEFAKFLCLKHHNRPDNCEEYSQWAKEVKEIKENGKRIDGTLNQTH